MTATQTNNNNDIITIITIAEDGIDVTTASSCSVK